MHPTNRRFSAFGLSLSLSLDLGLAFGMGLCLSTRVATANVSAPMFQDNMVIQRRMAAPIFGTAAPGEAVTVSFRGQTKAATAGQDGRWQVKLDATEAGGPFQMGLKGNNTLTLNNVMVGEVWLCGGQSNMQRTLSGMGQTHLDTGRNARNTLIRSLSMTSQARWAVCTTTTALNFSAVAYYFGKDLQQALGVPIGLIATAVGGTPVERWMDTPGLRADPDLAKDTLQNDLYRKWITPVQPYGIRGAIWYQGESNGPNSQFYEKRFGSMIGGWRKAWGQGDFPFYLVQLANYKTLQTGPGDTSRFAEVREAQRHSLRIANTAMAVTIELGEAGDIHPQNKWDVGRRLALPAKHLIYGREQDRAYSGPLFDTCRRMGGLVRIRFDHAYGGLKARAGSLTGFALAGPDGKWHWAQAQVRGDTIIASAAEVPSPAKVRYAYASNPVCNLVNGVGLPGSPFEEAVPPEIPTALADGSLLRYPGDPALERVPHPGARDALGRKASGTARLPRFVPTP